MMGVANTAARSVFSLLLAAVLCAAEPFEGVVTAVHDGDTLTARLSDDRLQRVRLAWIDCPELSQPFGERAAERTRELALTQRVRLVPHGHDRYRRLLADVLLRDGSSLAQVLLRDGLAWRFDRYSTDVKLGELQTTARSSRQGLWVDPDPIPPWTWRARSRGAGHLLPSTDPGPPGNDAQAAGEDTGAPKPPPAPLEDSAALPTAAPTSAVVVGVVLGLGLILAVGVTLYTWRSRRR